MTAAGPFRAACVQLTSDRAPEKTFPAAAALVREAASAGASLVMTPEVTPMLEPRGRLVLEKARPEAADEWLPRYRSLARETGVWLLLGSMAVRVDEGRCANRSLLIGPDGTIVARYDKIHMFDVDLEGGESYRESRRYRPGGEAIVADTPWGRMGMTICYDMRFPALYRDLAQAGADYLAVPSAFARPTGRAHWRVLLRARAIETGCFVFAPAQCGEHAEGRRTYGALPHRRPVGRGAGGRRGGARGGDGGDRPRPGPGGAADGALPRARPALHPARQAPRARRRLNARSDRSLRVASIRWNGRCTARLAIETGLRLLPNAGVPPSPAFPPPPRGRAPCKRVLAEAGAGVRVSWERRVLRTLVSRPSSSFPVILAKAGRKRESMRPLGTACPPGHGCPVRTVETPRLTPETEH